MDTINCIAVTISFKQKFVDWVNQLPEKDDIKWTLDMLNEEKSVYLVPEFDSNEEAEEWFGPHKTLILEESFLIVKLNKLFVRWAERLKKWQLVTPCSQRSCL